MHKILSNIEGMNPPISIIDLANSIELTDHHCHGVEKTNLERADFEIIATESDWPEPNGMTIFAAKCAPSIISHLIDAIPRGVSIFAEAKEKPSPGRGAKVMWR